MADLDEDEGKGDVKEVEEEVILMYMPVVQTFSDFPLCTDQVSWIVLAL